MPKRRARRPSPAPSRHLAKTKIPRNKSRNLVKTERSDSADRSRQSADLYSPEKRARFIAALSMSANVTLAAEESGVTRHTVYNWRNSDPEFDKEVKLALERGVDALEDEAKRRATGYMEDIVYQGRVTGKVRRASDILLIFLLKAHRPEKYRDAQLPAGPQLSADDQRRIEVARDVLKRLSTDELSTIATVMEKAEQRAVARAIAPPPANGKRTLQ